MKPAICVKIGGDGSKPYKSISLLKWDDIPPLAVLTGLNGSGKTQLLELLAFKLSNTKHSELGYLETSVEITGDEFGPDSIAYLPSGWEFTGAIHLGLAQMQDAKRHLYQQMKQDTSQDMRMNAKRSQILKLIDVNSIHDITDEQFINRLPDDYAFMLDETDVTAGLAYVFLAYRLRFLQELESGHTREQAFEKLGLAPWDMVNEILAAAEFPYQVRSPSDTGLMEIYKLELSASDGQVVRPADLSSGERMLLGVALWLYNSKHHGRVPKLFLLDEPDAHLHPSMTHHFLRVVHEVLVGRYGVRTILTTHSPTTVALAPEGSVFEMERGGNAIRPSVSKQATIGLLTAGLVTVSSSTRYILVEDETDVLFYEAVRDVLTDYGPSRDAQAIKSSPTLVFLPSSRGKGQEKVGGGCKVVKQWVDKFSGAPLEEVVRGIIDLDVGNDKNDRIEVIGRHSIENYLLDPFVLFGLLNSIGKNNRLPEVGISQGDEHEIRFLPTIKLQEIVNAVGDIAKAHVQRLGIPQSGYCDVTFTNSRICRYPDWMLKTRGHDLMNAFRSAFDHGEIQSKKLIESFRRVRMIPVELAAVMQNLQN